MDDRQKPPTGKRARKDTAPTPAPEAVKQPVKEAIGPALTADPEIDPARREKIERIKKAVADGTYRIPSEDVARKLIDHMREPKR